MISLIALNVSIQTRTLFDKTNGRVRIYKEKKSIFEQLK